MSTTQRRFLSPQVLLYPSEPALAPYYKNLPPRPRTPVLPLPFRQRPPHVMEPLLFKTCDENKKRQKRRENWLAYKAYKAYLTTWANGAGEDDWSSPAPYFDCPPSPDRFVLNHRIDPYLPDRKEDDFEDRHEAALTKIYYMVDEPPLSTGSCPPPLFVAPDYELYVPAFHDGPSLRRPRRQSFGGFDCHREVPSRAEILGSPLTLGGMMIIPPTPDEPLSKLPGWMPTEEQLFTMEADGSKHVEKLRQVKEGYMWMHAQVMEKRKRATWQEKLWMSGGRGYSLASGKRSQPLIAQTSSLLNDGTISSGQHIPSGKSLLDLARMYEES